MALLLASAAAAAPSWSPGPPAPPAPPVRRYGPMVYDAARSRVVLFGGETSSQVLDDTWEFDGARWTPGAAPPASMGGRSWHAMAYHAGRQRTVLFGGRKGFTTQENDTWEYTGTAWLPGPAAPAGLEPRGGAAMAYDSDRARAVLYGGMDLYTGAFVDTWEYDGTAWIAGPTAGPSGRASHAMAYDPARRRTVMFAGISWSGQPLRDVWEYDGATWLPAPSPPAIAEARFSTAMTFHDTSGAILMAGGYGFSGTMRDAWLYDGASWTRVADVPSGRSYHGLAYDAASARSFSFGGFNCQGETLAFDGASWSVVPGALVPRGGHAMAYDSDRARVVVHGGRDALSTLLDETWELTSVRWMKVNVVGPGARSGARMVYDGGRRRTVLFGGDSFKSDTWEYDGSAWRQVSIPPPSGRGWQDHGMAYDAARQRVVVFGGREDSNSDSNETWEFDGTAWTAGGASPPTLWPRRDAAMAYDSARGAIVLFGGISYNILLADTWEYTGSWRGGRQAPPALSPRHGSAMAADPTRSVLVLFGGLLDRWGNYLTNETWEYGPGGWSPGATAPAGLSPRTTELASFPPVGGVVLYGGETPQPVTRLNDTWVYAEQAPPPPSPDIVTGQGLGQPNPNRVRVFTAQGGTTPVDVLAYAAGAWGVNVAAGAIDGSTLDEMVTGPGPGTVLGPQVRAFQADGTPIAKVSFYAYGTLRYGANVARARIDGDAFAEILTAPGPGTVFGPHVRGFDYDGQTVAAITKVSFFAFGTLQYGATVAGGDVDGDGLGEILAGPGPGPSFAAQARGFDYDGAVLAPISTLSFAPFAPGYGLELSAGDLDADAFAEIAASPGPGPANAARVLGFDYDGNAVSALPGADVTPYATFYGARTSTAALLPDTAGREEMAVGAGRDPAAASTVLVYRYLGSLVRVGTPFLPFPGGYGVNVALGRLGYP